MAELVIPAFFIVIAENLIGFGSFLELLFRLLVPGVAVGMQFHGQLAVGLLQLIGPGLLRDTEHFVVVAFHQSILNLQDSR